MIGSSRRSQTAPETSAPLGVGSRVRAHYVDDRVNHYFLGTIKKVILASDSNNGEEDRYVIRFDDKEWKELRASDVEAHKGASNKPTIGSPPEMSPRKRKELASKEKEKQNDELTKKPRTSVKPVSSKVQEPVPRIPEGTDSDKEKKKGAFHSKSSKVKSVMSAYESHANSQRNDENSQSEEEEEVQPEELTEPILTSPNGVESDPDRYSETDEPDSESENEIMPLEKTKEGKKKKMALKTTTKEKDKNKRKNKSKKKGKDEEQLSKASEDEEVEDDVVVNVKKKTPSSKTAKKANDEHLKKANQSKVPRRCDDMNPSSEDDGTADTEDEGVQMKEPSAVRKLKTHFGVTQDKNGVSRFDDPQNDGYTRYLKLQGTHVYGYPVSHVDANFNEHMRKAKDKGTRKKKQDECELGLCLPEVCFDDLSVLRTAMEDHDMIRYHDDKIKKIKYFGARKLSGEKRFAYIPTEDPEIVVPYYDTILSQNGGYYTWDHSFWRFSYGKDQEEVGTRLGCVFYTLTTGEVAVYPLVWYDGVDEAQILPRLYHKFCIVAYFCRDCTEEEDQENLDELERLCAIANTIKQQLPKVMKKKPSVLAKQQTAKIVAVCDGTCKASSALTKELTKAEASRDLALAKVTEIETLKAEIGLKLQGIEKDRTKEVKDSLIDLNKEKKRGNDLDKELIKVGKVVQDLERRLAIAKGEASESRIHNKELLTALMTAKVNTGKGGMGHWTTESAGTVGYPQMSPHIMLNHQPSPIPTTQLQLQQNPQWHYAS